MRLLPELSSRVPGHPAHGRLAGMVDHADDIAVRDCAIKTDRVKKRLLYRRAVITPSHRAGIGAPVKLPRQPIAVEGSLWLTIQREQLGENARGAALRLQTDPCQINSFFLISSLRGLFRSTSSRAAAKTAMGMAA